MAIGTRGTTTSASDEGLSRVEPLSSASSFATLLLVGCSDAKQPVNLGPCDTTDGQCILRHDALGDEQLWTYTLRLHEVARR